VRVHVHVCVCVSLSAFVKLSETPREDLARLNELVFLMYFYHFVWLFASFQECDRSSEYTVAVRSLSSMGVMISQWVNKKECRALFF